MTSCATSATTTFDHTDTGVRVMRWTYRRNEETIICELGLNSDHSAYEMRVALPPNLSGVRTELFNDAISAFQRHGAIERTLVREGWSLESFQSERVQS